MKHRTFSFRLEFREKRLVLFMRTDPKPFGMIALHFRQRAMTSANSCRPVAANFLKVERWMLRILQPKLEILSRETLD